MADSKLTDLTNDASPTGDDLIYTVNDPSGTPGDRKVTLTNLAAALAAFPAFTSAFVSVNGPFLKDFARVSLTSGDISLTSTSVAAVSASLDLTLSAASGDLIEFGWDAITGNEAQNLCFDVYTMVGGSPVNPFGAGLSASAASLQGVSGWEIDNIAENFNLGVPVFRTLAGGDISGGTVTLRLFYVKPNSTARTLFADTNLPLVVWAKNYGTAP